MKAARKSAKKVTVNAGHGMKNSGVCDPGAVGPSGLSEAVQALEVAEIVEKELKQAGWDTLLVQDGDLRDVVNKSNYWGADYFISIHCNAAVPKVRGVETYAYLPGGMGEKMARAIQKELVRATGQPDRGVKFAGFHVLKYTYCPAVLVETGFISNPETEALMKLESYDRMIARAICAGFSRAVRG